MAIDTSTVTSSAGSAASSAANVTPAQTQDRFLRLLVAQMKNQDPMNPMDNAQVTSQMAQIQTVSGLETLNNTVKSLTGQFTQMQTLQGITMVGHNVLVPGNRLNISDGIGSGSYALDATASAVKLEVLNSGGAVVDTIDLGGQQAGRHSFSIPTDKFTDPNLSFRITASSGKSAIASSTFAQDKVMAISNSNGNLQLELQNLGLVDYSKVTALN
jgi:flagellar basal-body rod modification protein FlgD